MKRICIKLFTLLTLAVTLMGSLLMPRETSAKLEGGYGVPLTGDPVVVDSITLYGVTVTAEFRGDEGPYDDDDYYACRGLVERFYKEVFGVNIQYNFGGIGSDSGTFRETRDPKIGDIIYYTNGRHVALVKERHGDQVLSIQQNSWWGDKNIAWVGATANIYDDTLRFFTWEPGETLPEGCHVPTVTFRSLSADCTEKTAILFASIDNRDCTEIQGIGCRVYDRSGNLLKEVTRNMSCCDSTIRADFDLYLDMGMALSPTEVYSYEFVVYHNGYSFPSARNKFCTGTVNLEEMPDVPVASPKFASPHSDLTFFCKATNITGNNATLSFTVEGDGYLRFDWVSVFIGRTTDCSDFDFSAKLDNNVETRTFSLDICKEMGIELEPNSNYYYYFSCWSYGDCVRHYVSHIYSFATEN